MSIYGEPKLTAQSDNTTVSVLRLLKLATVVAFVLGSVVRSVLIVAVVNIEWPAQSL